MQPWGLSTAETSALLCSSQGEPEGGKYRLVQREVFGVSSTSAPTEGKPTMLEHTLNAVKLLGTGIFLRHLPFLLMLK